LKSFIGDHFTDAKGDLSTCFIERAYVLTNDGGCNAMVTMQSWMFLSSFKRMREQMLREKTVRSMAHLGGRAFASISGEVVQTTACVLQNRAPLGYKPTFVRLLEGGEAEKQATLASGQERFDAVAQDEFQKIPGSPLAYWVSDRVFQVVEQSLKLGDIGSGRMGLATGNNDRFVRLWHECERVNIGIGFPDRVSATTSGLRWFPYAKGGQYRKWYGNNEYLVDWFEDGKEIRTTLHPSGKRIWAHNFNLDHIFQSSVTWALITSGSFSVRFNPPGCLFDGTGACGFFEANKELEVSLGLLNTKFVDQFSRVLNPTLAFQAGDFENIPYREDIATIDVRKHVQRLVELSRFDWDAYERSWDFQSLSLMATSSESAPTLESSYTAWITQNRDTIAEMKSLEEENNRLFIDAYGLQDELTPDVPIEQITLTVNPAYRYGKKLNEEEQWTRFSQDTMEELVSYAIGCMMGRYSLDESGLIYAHSGNEGFDPSRYPAFPADEDGIIPLTSYPWFEDDVANRVIEFISIAWDAAHLEENLEFLAANLSPKKNESSRDTICRYVCDKFFKDHLKTYKKRPIYWLFSSGKQKAFQCLVYLHRYNEGTLARMRTEYVIPLQGLVASRIDQLDRDIPVASSTSHRRKLEKERDTLAKHRVELQEFDEKLRHCADQRIGLDLDDGVKVNYGKFGVLLADVKAVTGKKPS